MILVVCAGLAGEESGEVRGQTRQVRIRGLHGPRGGRSYSSARLRGRGTSQGGRETHGRQAGYLRLLTRRVAEEGTEEPQEVSHSDGLFGFFKVQTGQYLILD